MIYEATLSEKIKLLSIPETGMGYQLIEARRENTFLKEQFIVYNSELIITRNSSFLQNKRKLFSEGYLQSLASAPYLELDLSSITLLPKSIILENLSANERTFSEKKRLKGGKGAKDNPKRRNLGSDTFVRVSAYEDDNRVDLANQRFKDGTYSTVLEDYQNCVVEQDDPVDRYALPNDEEIKWAFYVKPKTTDEFQIGVVQPAFGHSGGGIEAYFEKGTSSNTYLFKRSYGK